jgi:hypothetical protein
MDWSKLNLKVYSTGAGEVNGLICLPSVNVLHPVAIVKTAAGYKMENDPFASKARCDINKF